MRERGIAWRTGDRALGHPAGRGNRHHGVDNHRVAFFGTDPLESRTAAGLEPTRYDEALFPILVHGRVTQDASRGEFLVAGARPGVGMRLVFPAAAHAAVSSVSLRGSRLGNARAPYLGDPGVGNQAPVGGSRRRSDSAREFSLRAAEE